MRIRGLRGMEGRVTRNSVYIFLEKASVLGTSLAVFLLVARYMGKEALGQYAFAYGLSSLFWIFLDLGLNTSLIRGVAEGSRADVSISSVTALKLGLSPLVLAVLWAVGSTRGMSLPVFLFGTALVLNALGETFNSAFKGLRRMKYSTTIVVCVQALLLSGCILAILLRTGIVGVGLAHLSSRLFHLLFGLSLYRRRGSGMRWRPDIGSVGRMIKDSLFHIPASYFLLSSFNMGTAVVFYLLTDVRAAYFGAASKLCAAMFVLSTSFPEALFPEMAGSPEVHLYTGTSRRFLLLTLPPVLLVVCFPREVLAVLYGGGYGPAAVVLRVLSAFLPVGIVCVLLHYLLVARGRGKVGFLMLCAMSGWCLASSFALVPRMGPAGAAVASSSGASLLLLGLYFYFTRKVAHVPLRGTLMRASVFVTLSSASLYLTSTQGLPGAALGCLGLWSSLMWVLGRSP